jgi:hypothetical protein
MINIKVDATNESENPRGYIIGTVGGKNNATGGLNQVLRCTNLTLATKGSYMNKQVQVVLGETTLIHPYTR